mgnify:FL=1
MNIPSNFKEIDYQIEVDLNIIPNSDLTYRIYFNGLTQFIAELEVTFDNMNRVSIEDAPKLLLFNMDKPLSEFTDEEKQDILDYRGLNLGEHGFEPIDVFLESSYIKLASVYVVQRKTYIKQGFIPVKDYNNTTSSDELLESIQKDTFFMGNEKNFLDVKFG